MRNSADPGARKAHKRPHPLTEDPPSKKPKHGGDHVRNRAEIPHEVFGLAGSRAATYQNAATTTSSVLFAPSLPGPRHSESSPSTFPSYNGSPDSLPLLPEIPDQIASVVFTHQHAIEGSLGQRIHLSYDRLEFLGDAYLEVIATRLIYPRFPQLPVGRLSQQREMLVKNETLATYAVAYGFDKRLKLPSDAQKPKDVKKWTKMMGDVMEAYVAAVILSNPDDGFQIAENWLHSLWEDKLAALQPAETQLMDTEAKVKLCQKVVSKGIKLDYREDAPSKPMNKEGKIWFHVGVFITGWGFTDVKLGSGMGLSKQEAGQKAAADAIGKVLTEQIERIKKDHDRRVREAREAEIAREANSALGMKRGGESSSGESSEDDSSPGDDTYSEDEKP